MDREPRAEDWQTLGIDPDASLQEVHEAYSRRKSVYAPDSLASYSLHEPGERELLLEKIESAYLRISRAAQSHPVQGSAPDVEQLTGRPTGPPPSLDDRPGAYLRYCRLDQRMTLAQLAEETKIRAVLLELLESETFSELPVTVYVRGFVIQCAKALGIKDPEGLATAYLAKMEESSA